MEYKYWYLSAAAEAAIEAEFKSDRRRSWWPFLDSVTLSTLRGRARQSAMHYRESRDALISKAGAVQTDLGLVGAPRRRCAAVTMPGEPLDLAGVPAEIQPGSRS